MLRYLDLPAAAFVLLRHALVLFRVRFVDVAHALLLALPLLDLVSRCSLGGSRSRAFAYPSIFIPLPPAARSLPSHLLVDTLAHLKHLYPPRFLCCRCPRNASYIQGMCGPGRALVATQGEETGGREGGREESTPASSSAARCCLWATERSSYSSRCLATRSCRAASSLCCFCFSNISRILFSRHKTLL